MMKFAFLCLLLCCWTQKKPLLLEVIVKDQLSNRPIPNVQVRIQGADGWTENVETDPEGVARLNVETKSRYRLTLLHPSYYVLHPPEIALEETAPTQLIFLQPIHKGSVIRWDGIQFDVINHTLLKDSEPAVARLTNFLVENKELKVEIGSHTDTRGKSVTAMQATRQRAQSLREELIRRGISPDRLLTRGYGGRLVLNQCTHIKCDTEEHLRNRRIELIILDNQVE